MKRHDEYREFRDIREDYAWNEDMMSDEDERVYELKRIISTRLPLEDRTLFLLYVDCQSYRMLARRLGVSHMSIRKAILKIKKKILEEYGCVHGNADGVGGHGLCR